MDQLLYLTRFSSGKLLESIFFLNKRGEKSTFVNLSITTINLEKTMKKKKLIWMNFALSIVIWNMNYY